MATNKLSIAAKNLDFLMKKHNLNLTTLANLVKANQPTLFRIMSGESADPRTASLEPYARYFGIDVSDLRTKDLTNDADANTRPAYNLHGKIPVINWTQITDWDSMQNNIENVSEWRSTTRPHSDKTFALVVTGLSMYHAGHKESFEEGDVILVDPEREAVSGSLVIVELSTGKFSFRKLYIEDGKMFLTTLNPHWNVKITELENINLIKGVVFEKQVDF